MSYKRENELPVTADANPFLRRRFSTHVAWTVAARLLMTANSVIAGVIVARLLGAEGLGALAVVNVTVALALQIGSAGLPSANTYFIARDRRNLKPVWANTLAFALAAGSALALLIIALAALRPGLFGNVAFRLVAIAAVSVPPQLVTLLGLNIFLGLNRIGRFNILDAAAQLFTLVNVLLALVLFRAGLATLVSLNTAAALLVSLLMVWMISRLLREHGGDADAGAFRPEARLFKGMARYGLKVHISVVAAMLIFRADLMIVNHFRGTAEAGVYAVASQVAMMLMLLPGIIGTLLMPRAASEGDGRGELTMRATRHTAFVMLFICLLTVPAAFALPLLYGAPFADATAQLLILLPGVYLVGVEAVLVQHFNSTGLPTAIPVFWLITLVINIALNVALVPHFGARGAAIASTLSYALIFILVASLFRMRTGNRLSTTLFLRARELRELFALARVGVSSR
ncbi:MAG TPA: oligosaccharide flippase family protein [Pyrinomonadaceae bacterium]|jgi:O-antigen/teichoic acid export membrane protein|nr:oligosaccharide flippase family protein [Pyrinomonadaceae bacterium]